MKKLDMGHDTAHPYGKSCISETSLANQIWCMLIQTFLVWAVKMSEIRWQAYFPHYKLLNSIWLFHFTVSNNNEVIRIKLNALKVLQIKHKSFQNRTFRTPIMLTLFHMGIEILGEYFCDNSMSLYRKWVKSGQYFS